MMILASGAAALIIRRGLQAAHARHINTQNDHIRFELFCFFDGLRAVPRVSNNFPFVLRV